MWPDIVVTENSLSQAISELRRTLGDNKSAPKYIQTIPNQGYRLCITETEKTKTTNQFNNKGWWVVACAIIICVGITLGFLLLDDSSKKVYLSPDGNFRATITEDNHLAVIATDLQRADALFLRNIALLSPKLFSWSPDSRYFAVVTTAEHNQLTLVISSVTSFERYAFSIDTDNDSQLPMLLENKSNLGQTPLAFIERKQLSPNVQRFDLNIEQAIQLTFDGNKLSQIDWYSQ